MNDWKPTRRGTRYCSPACGHGCTYDEYVQAKREAAEGLKLLPKGWRARVWENSGWWWELEYADGHITLSRSGKYWKAMASAYYVNAGDPVWGVSVKDHVDPRKALREIALKLSAHIDTELALLKELHGAKKTT